MDKWPYGVLGLTKDVIDSAVTDLGWQDFRVSLKGTTTQFKLLRLEYYLFGHLKIVPCNGVLSLKVDFNRAVRVSNYINALKRGGQLNDQLEVVR